MLTLLEHTYYELPNPAVISHTQGRYVLDKDTKIVYDNYLKKEIHPDPDSGLYLINVLEQYNMTYWELYMLSFKANHIPTHDFLKALGNGAIFAYVAHPTTDADELSIDLNIPSQDLAWFIDVDCSNIAGARYIPFFTRYVMDNDFNIYQLGDGVFEQINEPIHWETKDPVEQFNNIILSLQRDDGVWVEVYWIDIVGMMFLEPKDDPIFVEHLFTSRQYIFNQIPLKLEDVENGYWLSQNIDRVLDERDGEG